MTDLKCSACWAADRRAVEAIRALEEIEAMADQYPGVGIAERIRLRARAVLVSVRGDENTTTGDEQNSSGGGETDVYR